jgi:hypothetical protein
LSEHFVNAEQPVSEKLDGVVIAHFCTVGDFFGVTSARLPHQSEQSPQGICDAHFNVENSDRENERL